MCGFSDVETLSLEREHSEEVSSDDAQSADCQRLGRVPFGQDQRALRRLPRPRLVRVLQLRNALQLRMLLAAALLVQLRLKTKTETKCNATRHDTCATAEQH